MTAVIVTLIFAPAIISIIYALFAVWRWILSRRDASTKSELLVGVLGPLSLLFPRTMSDQSKKYFSRFVLALSFFIIYTGGLLLLFGK